MADNPMPEHAAPGNTGGYTPVFSDQVRTIIYIVSFIGSLVSLGFLCAHQTDIAAYIATASGALASAFGVSYNPLRLAGK